MHEIKDTSMRSERDVEKCRLSVWSFVSFHLPCARVCMYVHLCMRVCLIVQLLHNVLGVCMATEACESDT